MSAIRTNIGAQASAHVVPHTPTATIPRTDAWAAIQYVYDWFAALVPSVGAAPKDAQYLVAASDSTLTAERVTTNTATVEWDHATAAQAKANIPDDAITFVKLQNLTSDRLIGRDTASSGDPEEISVGGGLEFTGSAGIQRSALTGDVAASAGSNSTAIQNDAVTDAKLRDSAAVSVIGRSANSSGDPADIAASANDTLLRRVADALSWGALTLGMIPANLITYAKIQQVSATSRILGRRTASAGDIEECTLSQILDFVGSAANGDILHRSGGSWTRLGIGSDGQVLTLASGLPSWAAAAAGGQSAGIHNCKITESNNGTAATYALKTLAGNDPSGGDPVTAVFPDGTSVSITAALSVTIPSGAELGFQGSVSSRIWVALVNDSGTPRLVVRNCRSSSNNVVGFPATGLLTSTTIGSGADSAHVSYSDSGVTAKPYVIAARADYESGLSTPGTWDASPTRIVQHGPGQHRPGDVVQQGFSTSTGNATTNSTTPVQTPLTHSISLTSPCNLVEIDVRGCISTGQNSGYIEATISRGTGPTNIGSSQRAANQVAGYVDSSATMKALDFPGTTSATAYYAYIVANGALGVAAEWNRLGATCIMEVSEVMA